MTPMVPYQGAELQLYLEALRVVPARTAARIRGSENDAYMLIRDYLNLGADLGVPNSSAWSIMAVAAECVIVGLVNLVADVEETSQSEVAERMVAAAVDQVASGAI